MLSNLWRERIKRKLMELLKPFELKVLHTKILHDVMFYYYATTCPYWTKTSVEEVSLPVCALRRGYSASYWKCVL